MNIVNAVVVTYNRKDLLQECLNALFGQTYKLNKIIVINNASNDGTDILLKEEYSVPEIECYNLDKNTGGAGGFYVGTKIAYKDCDWIWEMDDDTVPSLNALENLMMAANIIEGDISFLASTVFGINGEPMNVPIVNGRPSLNGYPNWYKYLKDGIVEIENATLVSLLFNSKAVEKIGAPHPYFFIWGDDTEYTLRMTRCYGKAYFIGKSIVVHKRKGGKNLTIFEENSPNKIKMYKFYYRNNLVSKLKYGGKKMFFKFLLNAISDSFKSLIVCKEYKFLRFKTIQYGIVEFFMGKYNKLAFESRFDNIYKTYLDEFLLEKNEL